MVPQALTADFPALVETLSYLQLEDVLRCACTSQAWCYAAHQPEAFARCIHLPCASFSLPPAGLQHLIKTGCLEHVNSVILIGACSWFPEMLANLPRVQHLMMRAETNIRPRTDANMVLSSILSVASRLQHLDFSREGFKGVFSEKWPSLPALKIFSLEGYPLTLTDISDLCAAQKIEFLKFRNCPLLHSQAGIIRCGQYLKPLELAVLDSGVTMALTLLLSMSLSRLAVLRLDKITDSKLREEIQRVLQPMGGGIDSDAEADADLQMLAEAELRSDHIRRLQRQGSPFDSERSEKREAAGGPWKLLKRWMESAQRFSRSSGEVHYRLDA